MIADMAMEVEAARLLVWKAAWSAAAHIVYHPHFTSDIMNSWSP
jgi:alkylation response protein AidB-like acyl-CoA dehydrogenase